MPTVNENVNLNLDNFDMTIGEEGKLPGRSFDPPPAPGFYKVRLGAPDAAPTKEEPSVARVRFNCFVETDANGAKSDGVAEFFFFKLPNVKDEKFRENWKVTKKNADGSPAAFKYLDKYDLESQQIAYRNLLDYPGGAKAALASAKKAGDSVVVNLYALENTTSWAYITVKDEEYQDAAGVKQTRKRGRVAYFCSQEMVDEKMGRLTGETKSLKDKVSDQVKTEETKAPATPPAGNGSVLGDLP